MNKFLKGMVLVLFLATTFAPVCAEEVEEVEVVEVKKEDATGVIDMNDFLVDTDQEVFIIQEMASSNNTLMLEAFIIVGGMILAGVVLYAVGIWRRWDNADEIKYFALGALVLMCVSLIAYSAYYSETYFTISGSSSEFPFGEKELVLEESTISFDYKFDIETLEYKTKVKDNVLYIIEDGVTSSTIRLEEKRGSTVVYIPEFLIVE